ncbi:MBL fold metallo-hydrolase RNA specificity domain-containing protein [Pseudomonas cavernae]|uniref:MBL fold metallo-hydrolase RNA specificity domain-containing protein n=1 Tax=Pseudomonas cavernae TaxID=2320867 RepID=UPI001EE596D7|nr:MBL fold metallo-hydrolase RNA specificity domain-containing protein [Pseudomonas cavernae]
MKIARSVIVVGGNGMCSSGRIVNYLKAMRHDLRHNVLLRQAGFQAYGPIGGYVVLDEQRYDIRAQVHTIGGYSFHADQKGLVNFVTRMRAWTSGVRIVDGEPQAKQRLAEMLSSKCKGRKRFVDAVIPS